MAIRRRRKRLATDEAPAYEVRAEPGEGLLRLIKKNIESLRRERSLGTPIDPAMIRELEERYRSLSAESASNRDGDYA